MFRKLKDAFGGREASDNRSKLNSSSGSRSSTPDSRLSLDHRFSRDADAGNTANTKDRERQSLTLDNPPSLNNDKHRRSRSKGSDRIRFRSYLYPTSDRDGTNVAARASSASLQTRVTQQFLDDPFSDSSQVQGSAVTVARGPDVHSNNPITYAPVDSSLAVAVTPVSPTAHDLVQKDVGPYYRPPPQASIPTTATKITPVDTRTTDILSTPVVVPTSPSSITRQSTPSVSVTAVPTVTGSPVTNASPSTPAHAPAFPTVAPLGTALATVPPPIATIPSPLAIPGNLATAVPTTTIIAPIPNPGEMQSSRLRAVLRRDLTEKEQRSLEPSLLTNSGQVLQQDASSLVQSTLDAAKQALTSAKESHKVTKFLKLDTHLIALQKVAQIGDIAVQHSPETTALVWAGVRFLLQIAIHDIETREHLESAMDTITAAIGNAEFYEAFYLKAISGPSGNGLHGLELALAEFYAAIIVFAVRARAYIENKQWLNAIKGVFKPFDLHFKPLTDNITAKEKLVDNAARNAGLEDNRNNMVLIRQQMDEFRIIMEGNLKAVVDVKQQLEELGTLETKDLRKCYKWLGGLEHDNGYEKNYNLRSENTCTWILQTPAYLNWKAGMKGILWICGIPGAGKSVLASYIIRTIVAEQQIKSPGSPLPVLHYFFQHTNSKTSSALTMASTITYQLLRHSGDKNALALLKKRHDISNCATCEDFNTIWEIFREAIEHENHTRHGTVYVVVDALDECSNETREMFLNALCASDWLDLGVQFLVTSREMADIAIKLEPPTTKTIKTLAPTTGSANKTISACPPLSTEEPAPSISLTPPAMSTKQPTQPDPQGIALKLKLEVNAVDKDITKFIGVQLKRPEYIELVPHQDIICKTIPAKSKGMFRYAALLLHELNEPSSLENNVTKILEMIPPGLGGIYRWILERLDTRTLKIRKKIFLWLMVCARPITLEELGLALTTKDGEANFDPKGKGLFSGIKLLKACGPLVEIGPNETVQFSHFTVKEFLQMRKEAEMEENMEEEEERRKRQKLGDVVAACSVDNNLAHISVFTTCVTQLLSLRFLNSMRNAISFPYCITYWIHHAVHAQLEGDAIEVPQSTKSQHDLAWELTANLLGASAEGPCFKVWKDLFPEHIIEFGGSCLGGSRNDIRCVRALHITANWGLAIPTKRLIQDPRIDIEARDKTFGQTPLSWAAENGHTTVVKLLLDRGADIETTDPKYGRTPLLWATVKSHSEVVQILLERGANREAKDYEPMGRTPLLWATIEGRKELVELLLKSNADVGSREDTHQRTAVVWAAAVGHLEICRLLLDGGADVNCQDGVHGRSPLSWAAEKGFTEVVQLLIERGADVHVMDKDMSRLQEHSPNTDDQTDTDPFELGWGVGAESDQDGQWWDDQQASPGGLEEMKNVEEISKDTDACGGTALTWAAQNGHVEIVRTLLEKNVNIEAINGAQQRTPLSLAAGGGHTEVVRILLEHGASLKTQDAVYSQSPTEWAAQGGHVDTVRLLLENTVADSLSRSDVHGNSLILAATGDWTEIVDLLLDKGDDLEAKDDTYGQSALSIAAERGNPGLVRMLLSKHANIEVTDDRYDRQTPLSLAAQNNHAEIVQLLLKQGANIEAADSRRGRTPLLWAAVKGHTEVAAILIANGADLNATENGDEANNQAALSLAAENGHIGVVRQLLAKGVDIDARDALDRTPLLWAAMNGHGEVLVTLLAGGAEINVFDSQHKRTPLGWATMNGHKEVLSLLLPKDRSIGSAAWGGKQWKE